jgi:DNA-binding transcriptional ArsR family regulator
MDAAPDEAVSRVAAAIGEPARARILCCLMDGRARTSTELAVVADVSPSTASAHLGRLRADGLILLQTQGRHRYYTLGGPQVAQVLEGLLVLAGSAGQSWAPRTPARLHLARTCYDHLAGTLGVELHDRLVSQGWLRVRDGAYDLTPEGGGGLKALGIEVDALKGLRRKLACACLDWSERRCHLGGALGAALLDAALRRKWVSRETDGRALLISATGRRELLRIFALRI